MPITVTFYGPLERWAGGTVFYAEGTSVREVLIALEPQLGKSVLEHIIHPDTGRIKSHFHILLNGRDIESLNGLDEEVENGDSITCLPPVGGGVYLP
ncbi:MAG: MoaD/ThiS family protein [Candidatus Hodarchaeales archaeon]|jgi:molybdopterin synthase sulfur carrier subunit